MLAQVVNDFKTNLMVSTALNLTGLISVGSADRNPITRNAKRGLVIFAGRDAIRMLSEGKSITEIGDPFYILDEVAFAAIGSAGMEMIDAGGMLAGIVDLGNRSINNIIVDTAVLTGIEVAGDYVYDSGALAPIRHFGQWVKKLW